MSLKAHTPDSHDCLHASRYLGSGLIKGIGPVMAERMVSRFGVDIMHIIDEERLRDRGHHRRGGRHRPRQPRIAD
jgi:hypothetical protein